MGKTTKKHAKGRLDKFYHLAKEMGYRSRASFKLIQINKVYNVLKDAKILIDLCAAPGSWLQVAANEMPSSSIILGFDLDPIKPIKNCKTYKCDITSQECLDIIKSQIHHMKADVVLNDGAPNVGGVWDKDAFIQNELVLASFKIASLHLRKGGSFITKVFRSKDTSSLIWALKKFFSKVNFVKPEASRNTSAETFIMCQGYLGYKVDPKYFDSKFIFKTNESDLQTILFNKEVNSINKIFRKKKVKIIESDTMTRFKTIKFEDFLKIDNPFAVFVEYNKIVLNDDELEKYSKSVKPHNSIKDEMEDLKLLNKGEVANILKWRSKLRHKLNLEKKNLKEVENKDKLIEEKIEEENEEDEEINKFEELKNKLERKKEKQNKKDIDKKLINFINNKEGLINIEEQIDELNTFSFVEKKDLIKKAKFIDFEDKKGKERNVRPKFKENEDISENLEFLYEVKKEKERKINENKEKIINKKIKKDNIKEVKFKEQKELITKNKNNEIEMKDLKKGSNWFDQEIFNIIDDKKESNKVKKELEVDSENDDDDNIDEENYSDSGEEYLFGGDIKKDIQKKNKLKNDKKKKNNPNNIEIVKEEIINSEDEELEFDHINEDEMAENCAIAKKMLRKNNRDKIIEDSCNRFTDHDNFEENLPEWFLEDERKHRGKIKPVTKEEIEEEKKRIKLLESTPSKKVLEAKQRKKKKLMNNLNKVKSKAEEILEDNSLNPRVKMNSINSIYKKAIRKSKGPRKQLRVMKKFSSGAPRKTTGRKFKVVDRRTKKDQRNQKFKSKNKSKFKRKK